MKLPSITSRRDNHFVSVAKNGSILIKRVVVAWSCQCEPRILLNGRNVMKLMNLIEANQIPSINYIRDEMVKSHPCQQNRPCFHHNCHVHVE